MSMGLELLQHQKMTLSPKMRQSVEILQMNALDLINHIQEASLENPLMDLADYEPEEDPAAARLKKLEWLDSMDESNTFRQPITREEDAQHPISGKNQSENLYDALYLQAAGLHIPEKQERILRHLIENLDENGYLKISRDQLLEQLGVSEKELDTAVSLLRQMEPAGVGARDLQDCLLLQVDRMDSPSPLLREIITHHLELIARNQLSVLAKKLGATVEEVKDAKDDLLELNPKPGNGFSSYNTIPYIRPDIFVVHFEDSFQVILNDFNQPKIMINNYYLNLAKQSNEETKDYVQKKFRQAEWLVSCINQRKQTILKCVESILKMQMDFFRYGPGHLAPLTLADIAEEVGVHPSTVSRAVSNKYLQCQWGVFQVNSFFTREISQNAEGLSQEKILARLRAIVEEEDRSKPLSDQAIAELLEEEGISISRRTVAKYRDILDIPASSRRKSY